MIPQSTSNTNLDLLITLIKDSSPEPNITVLKYKQYRNTLKHLSRKYNLIYDTLKATETRLKLQLIPSFITFSLTTTKTNTKALHFHIKNFFRTLNQHYHELLNNKLQETEQAIKTQNFNNYNPRTQHLTKNKGEWKNIKNLLNRPPRIKHSLTHPKQPTNIKFKTPLFGNHILFMNFQNTKTTFLAELALLIKGTPSIHTATETIKLEDQTFLLYKPTEYVSIILPQETPALILPPHILKTLDMGLNFTPYTHSYPFEDLKKEFTTFKHKLHWQQFFKDKPKHNSKHLPSKLNANKPRTAAPKQNPELKNWAEELEKTLTNTIRLAPPHPKLPPETTNFYKTITYFKTRPHLIIKPADKGSTITIMHQNFYNNLGLNYIQTNPEFFQVLEIDPLPQYQQRTTKLLDSLYRQGAINKLLHTILQPPKELKTPNLYFLPKIHKKPKITGRPISSANGHPAENISIFIDHILKELASSHPLYLKDSAQLLNLIHDIHKIPSHAIPFSIDVINMYTNIPTDELINTIYHQLTKQPQLLIQKSFSITPNTLKTLLKFVLNTNFFKFNNTTYKQIHGIAMGTACACAISDIFICNLVQENFFNWTYKPNLYRQYRDDSFGIWLHGAETLNDYLKYLNTIHTTMKFTLTTGPTIQYLDLNITLNNWGFFDTETYYKETDSFQYLINGSNHPKHITDNIPKSQIIRHIRNCSNPSSLRKHTHILTHNLLKRNYNLRNITNKLKSTLHNKRSNILKYSIKEPFTRTPLIITYNNNLPNLAKTLFEKNHPLLNDNPPILGYKIKPPLSHYLVKAKFILH